MVVVDTNILVRFAVNDDPKHVALAHRAIGSNEIWIGITVLLELEWVLRSRYGFERTEVLSFLRQLLTTASIQVEDEAQVATALDWYADGADFADALHLARSQSRGIMLTFDTAFCKPAQRVAGNIKVLRAAAK